MASYTQTLRTGTLYLANDGRAEVRTALPTKEWSVALLGDEPIRNRLTSGQRRMQLNTVHVYYTAVLCSHVTKIVSIVQAVRG